MGYNNSNGMCIYNMSRICLVIHIVLMFTAPGNKRYVALSILFLFYFILLIFPLLSLDHNLALCLSFGLQLYYCVDILDQVWVRILL